jgi:hypothetical protein
VAAAKTRKYSSDRRERMKELQAEGKMTPEHGKLGGRPRKVSPDTQKGPRPATAHLAAGIAELGPAMLRVVKDVLEDAEASDGAKLRALRIATGVELREGELQADEAKRAGPPPPPAFETPEEGAAQLIDKLRENPILRSRLLAVLTAADAPAGIPPKTG